MDEMEKQLGELDLDTSEIRARSLTRKRKRSESVGKRKRSKSVGDEIVREASRFSKVRLVRDRSASGVRDVKVTE